MRKIRRNRLAGTVWWAAAALLCAAGIAAAAAGSARSAVSAMAAGTERKCVALTFDDGPCPSTTPALLDGLRERGAAATFFVVGSLVPGNEALLERMQAEGHQVGQHTYSHASLATLSGREVCRELQRADLQLTDALGEGDYWLRPPYGQIRQEECALVSTPLIAWSVDPADWKLLNAEQVTDAVLSCAESGDIILLHDTCPTSVEAALRIVDALQAEEYSFLTVRQLFAAYGVEPQPGVLYRCVK